MTADDTIRVLIADDHQLFRDGLRALLLADPRAEVVGEAATGDAAVAMAASLQPDVILMDLQMPALNGIEATRQIVTASPHIRVLVVTMFSDDQSVFAAMRAGARGYLLKGASHGEMLQAIHAVAAGAAIFSPEIAVRMAAFFAAMGPSAAPPSLFPELSERERTILEMIAQGRKNAEIAAELVLSEKTVRNHVSNILSKLQVADRAQAMVRAREAGLV
ncbi:MAG: response regulator transcription factor [Chloroflexota bacterium]|nr:response regulator transcription factor [Chloroflexota bacterium]